LPIAPGVVAAALLLTPATAALARPLQEIVRDAKPAVVHLGVLSPDGEEIASGSGFLVSGDGYVATDFHVIDGAPRVRAVFADEHRADVIGVVAYDVEEDVAVVALAKDVYPYLALSPTPPHEGDEVTVIGSPRGLSGSISTGIVSAMRKAGPKLGGISYASWTLQISAPISPGSSGSPVLDSEGRVIGLAVGTESGQALNFAVPASSLKKILAKPASLHQLPVTRDRRTVRENLAISAVFLASIVAVWFTASRILTRKEREARKLGAPNGLDTR
jgi:S1-C subfamily serine protease